MSVAHSGWHPEEEKGPEKRKNYRLGWGDDLNIHFAGIVAKALNLALRMYPKTDAFQSRRPIALIDLSGFRTNLREV